MHTGIRRRNALAWLATVALSACGGGGGGGGDRNEAAASKASQAREAAQRSVLTAARVAPLVADDGSVAPSQPGAAPADRGAHTRTGRYATRAQADQLAEALGERLIRVRVDCCSPEAVDVAVGVVVGLQAAHQLSSDAPVLVDAADLRLGAATVNRLEADGWRRVWLVTP